MLIICFHRMATFTAPNTRSYLLSGILKQLFLSTNQDAAPDEGPPRAGHSRAAVDGVRSNKKACIHLVHHVHFYADRAALSGVL